MSYTDKLKSRKFQLALGAALAAIGAALQGQLSWEAATIAIITTVVAYIWGESAIDVAYARNGRQEEK